ncbi:hypothetical protein GU243_22110 [Pseudarthrobacter psychrotolerans]|uniref:Serine/threonine protein kinase n=1 Tax=Pseudarthrobacter psychrotolerans TaxID=2697569 RepID=A0A6P1NWK8_9MICC|nr:hypothetical protein [Pseudarthrobacter psychrotolerans]QHK21912.1 hypothetical protein GU243_22110 [Pseudarthrobacter psychrotolerans]
MRSLPFLARTVLAAALVLLATACSVTVPEGRAPAVGALLVSDPQEVPGQAERPTPAPLPSAAVPPSSSAASPGTPATASPGTPVGRPLNRAEKLLPKVNVKPWRAALPVVVQSANKDMQCSIRAEGAACHLLSDVAPRPADIKGQCAGLSQYFGGYAVVTVGGGAQYGLCGDGLSPMEAETVAGPTFPGPWIEDGQTVRIGNMVCSREPGAMVCAHLRTGHGFMISVAAYELW